MANEIIKLSDRLNKVVYDGLDTPETRELIRPEAEALKGEISGIVLAFAQDILTPGALDSGDHHKLKTNLLRMFKENL